MLATAKHFPGHGDTGTDSHLALPVIGADWARLDSVELVPFRAAIAAGVKVVMSAHIALPGIDRGQLRPGTVVPEVLTGILRTRCLRRARGHRRAPGRGGGAAVRAESRVPRPTPPRGPPIRRGDRRHGSSSRAGESHRAARQFGPRVLAISGAGTLPPTAVAHSIPAVVGARFRTTAREMWALDHHGEDVGGTIYGLRLAADRW
jgi:hypothetical protein